MANNSSTRTDRAARLLTENKIQLHVGRGYALVEGSKGGQYVVSRQGCTCKDAQNRDPKGCYHASAVRQLCSEYRNLQAAAALGKTVKPSAALMQALRWSNRTAAPAPAIEAAPTCGDCGASIPRGKTCTDCLDKALGFAVAA